MILPGKSDNCISLFSMFATNLLLFISNTAMIRSINNPFISFPGLSYGDKWLQYLTISDCIKKNEFWCLAHVSWYFLTSIDFTEAYRYAANKMQMMANKGRKLVKSTSFLDTIMHITNMHRESSPISKALILTRFTIFPFSEKFLNYYILPLPEKTYS